MLMGRELGLFVRRAVSLLRGCSEPIVSACSTKTAEESVNILRRLDFRYIWSLKCAQNCLFQQHFEMDKQNVLL
jgi:hypothetical protein